MDINLLLNSAINHYSDDYRNLFEHLRKCSNQLKISEGENSLPLLIFKNKEPFLWIKDDSVSEFPFLFSDAEEILFILYQYLSTGNDLYISSQLPIQLSNDQINKKIEESLLNNNKEEFKKWVELLKKNTSQRK